jgi:hypothetical protein
MPLRLAYLFFISFLVILVLHMVANEGSLWCMSGASTLMSFSLGRWPLTLNSERRFGCLDRRVSCECNLVVRAYLLFLLIIMMGRGICPVGF